MWFRNELSSLAEVSLYLVRRLMVTSLKAMIVVVTVNLLAGWNIFVGLFFFINVPWMFVVGRCFLSNYFSREVVYNFNIDRLQTRYLNTTGEWTELRSVYFSLELSFECWKERCKLLSLQRGAAMSYKQTRRLSDAECYCQYSTLNKQRRAFI